jgi:hypothetical protein
MALYKMKNDVHRVITHILSGVIGGFPVQSQLQISPEPLRTSRDDRSPLLVLMVSPAIDRLSLNPKPPAPGTLSQSQDDIRLVFLYGTDELAFVKSNGKDDFLEAIFPRKLPKNFFGDIIRKLPVRAEAVDQQAHRTCNR